MYTREAGKQRSLCQAYPGLGVIVVAAAAVHCGVILVLGSRWDDDSDSI